MFQQNSPEDFVIATGLRFSVRKFIEWSAEALGMRVRWDGSGVYQVDYCDGKSIVSINQRYFRPTKVESLLGDPSKAKQKLG
jgi:GDPmannose 4,6-dehydratase